MTDSRYLCLHGHFYQPPRENPWLEAVEAQASAEPYHNWNERITMECYGPNTAARISTWDGRILDIRNNYEKISFNFGPTLLSWLEENHPSAYADIIEADRLSVARRGGHGNALAQAYNHVIMPLATRREKLVQTVWGMEDFRQRFGRDPEGMWLPECAVDTETLECLADNGIKFTVLAPGQARSLRLLEGTGKWISVEGSRIDPTRAYVCPLPSGRSITLFFYDGPISQAIAFEGLLNDSHVFLERLMGGFNDERAWPQLLNIATDGESYGHHHRHGEMALAYTLHLIERQELATLTNYGEFLEKHPPTAEVRIWDNSSWSCVHGVERWNADCGCNSGGHPGWHQKWRGPLRQAFRYLADRASDLYDREAPRFLLDPSEAFLRYIHVLRDSNRLERFRRFLEEEAATPDASIHSLEILRLLEMMRNAQLLFTSCAWFFDEVSGIETVQNMKYAGRLIQLLQPYIPECEKEFLRLLEKAPSNLPAVRDGANCYLRMVKPNTVDLQRVIAHHAITRFDSEESGRRRLFCYEIHDQESEVSSFADTRLKLSRISALSLLDGESLEATAVVLHHGGHDFRCSLMGQLSYHAYARLKENLFSTYHKRSLTDLVRVVDETFGREYFALNHLFSEGRREILQRITDEAFHRFDTTLTRIYEENRRFMNYLLEAGAPLPQGFLSAAEFVLRGRFLRELADFPETSDVDELAAIAREANRYRIKMTDPVMIRRIEQVFSSVFDKLAAEPAASLCQIGSELLNVFQLLGLKPDHWEAQNIVFALVHKRPLPTSVAQRNGHAIVRTPEDARPALEELAQRLHISLEPFEKTAPALNETRPPHSTDRIAIISD